MSGTVITVESSERKNTERLAGVILWCLVVIGAITAADIFLPLRPYDATDDGQRRSGLGLRTDAGTGCEYLTTTGGGITPRLGSDGKQTGCRR